MIDGIKIVCAPMQGFTDYIWRNAHAQIFGGADKYFTPFVRVEHGKILNRDLRDVASCNNDKQLIVPQVLASKPREVQLMVEMLRQEGYTSIDINLGCPFPPIALHHKGSGLLQYPQEVQELFMMLSQYHDLTYSVKMRLGWEHDDEWEMIMPLFDLIRPAHITVHPRTGREQYRGELHLQQVEAMLKAANYPIVFNGGIESLADVERIKHKFPEVAGVMIGRSFIANPALVNPEKLTKMNLKAFHDQLFNDYTFKLSGGSHQVLNKMKAFWELFLPDEDHKARKIIKKSLSLEKYERAVKMLFANMDLG